MVFVHTADLHIDSPLRGLPRYPRAPVHAFLRATRRALQALTDLCIRENASFLLIVGDLFDGSLRDHKGGLFFVQQMLKLREHGILVYAVLGNHDADSPMLGCLLLPDNVVVLGPDGPQTVVLERIGIALHGQSYRSKATTDNLAAAYPRAVPGLFNIGLLHTSADGREGHDDYAPCTLKTLKGRAYDYWALGHVHRREVLSQAPWVLFPGNLQGRWFREQGEKGATLVEIDPNRAAAVGFRELDAARFITLTVDTTDARSFSDIADRTAAAICAELDKNGSERALAVRIELDGAPGIGTLLSLPQSRCVQAMREVIHTAGRGRVWLEQVYAQSGEPITTRWAVTDRLGAGECAPLA